jgi:tetratricopeptide (TPR) repeat protein
VGNNIDVDKLNKKASEKFLVKDADSCVIISDLVLTLDPNNSGALENRAIALEYLNYNLDAIKDFEKYIEIDGTDPNLYGLLGLTYRKIGEIEKGQEYLLKSIKMGFNLYEMPYNMLENCHEMVKKKMSEKGKIAENLKTRSAKDINGKFSEVDKEELLDYTKTALNRMKENNILNKNPELTELESRVRKHIESN